LRICHSPSFENMSHPASHIENKWGIKEKTV
jgi:hypothetical protein